MLRFFPMFVIGIFFVPITAGLVFTVLPAFGLLLPLTEAYSPSFQGWRQLLEWPGLASSLTATLISGIGSTLIALILALTITATFLSSRWFTAILRLQLPFLALPHAALAVGIAFLISPSGWITRLLSPWLSGWARPPDFLLPHDSLGFSLMLGLIIKELPFLLLMIFAALNQVKHTELLRMSRSLGYSPVTSFWISIFPQVYRQLRLPVFAVLAFSLSVVDMAMILGPGNPPTLAVQTLRWFNDPDLALRGLASAAAVFQLALIFIAILLWIFLEKLVRFVGFTIATSGARRGLSFSSKLVAKTGLSTSVLLASFSLIALLVWSFTKRWRFPDTLPKSWSLRTWDRNLDALSDPLMNALFFAATSALIALALALVCLENEQRRGKRISKLGLLVLYLPLIIPQVSFLFGVKVLAASMYQDGLWWTLLWSHLIFVVPYVLLTLSEPFHAIDPRYGQIGLTLGKSPWAVFWRIRLPLLMPSILFAGALGFAVSFTLYLPTLLLGAGRFPTLTTEAVALASGADRRVLSVYALMQALIPLVLFLAALGLGRRWGGRIQA